MKRYRFPNWNDGLVRHMNQHIRRMSDMKSPRDAMLKTIEVGLKKARQITRPARYGGLSETDQQLVEAQDALEWLRAYPDTLLEPLAALEHDQWVYWSKGVQSEVSEERRERWKTLQVPYDETSAMHKSSDRAWATATIQVFKTGLVDLRRIE